MNDDLVHDESMSHSASMNKELRRKENASAFYNKMINVTPQ